MVAISGSISFPDGRSDYLAAMNNAWSGNFGRYTVSTQMLQGTGGLTAYINKAPGESPTADIGGPNLNLNSAVGATPTQMAYARWAAGHELGHSFKLRDQYTEAGPNSGYENEIMGVDGGKPNETTIDSLLYNCK